ncbi:hypothetical protein KTI95_03235 [Acinetobacter baumannii]|nr:hypothetical protein [Acinetobacter baumannii]MDC4502193.1 hypothetical protein [Acinetobacter baumannii]MDV7635183.1 hypothetical protein [Acinetobacter baumannii]
MKTIYQLKIGDFAPSESTRSFTKEGYLKCVNVRLAKAPQVRQYYGKTQSGTIQIRLLRVLLKLNLN